MPKTIKVYTSDEVVWNRDELAAELRTTKDVVIDFCAEGPCLDSLGIESLLRYSTANSIQIVTSNAVEYAWPNTVYQPPMHFVESTQQLDGNTGKEHDAKTFGIFIGRSNAPRLYLSALASQYPTLQTFHWRPNSVFHKSNLGLDKLADRYGAESLPLVAEFLQQAPITLDSISEYPILVNHHLDIAEYYAKFFIEIVCETYFTGSTFFCTEKIWRPIAMRTPFIVQGPQNFLHNLKTMGFKTFDRWWDEGYSEDPADHQPIEISRVLEYLGSKTTQEIYAMYQEMNDILDHNYETLMGLALEDFLKVRNEQ